MKYTVCFLFTDNGERVLLQKKNWTQYSGQFNGVGGKIEPGETPLEGARREIRGEQVRMSRTLSGWARSLFPRTAACQQAGITWAAS